MASKKKKKKRKSVVALLRESPINYMSDLFIVAMVLSWIIVIFIMTWKKGVDKERYLSVIYKMLT